jgi:DMSO/TMAO reductase YedYZ molybdopterin-dependent catalytic subunit
MNQLRTLRLVENALRRLNGRDVEPPRLPLDRRDFLAAGAGLLVTSLLAACDSSGPKSSERLLTYAERKNEVVERWLLRHTSMNDARDGWKSAGSRFPQYFVSKKVPMWNPATNGEWSLTVDGLVDRPLRLTLADLVALPRRRQRVSHYCVEGWTAVAEFTGVQLAHLATMVRPHADARYVDFQSFDDGYHESWDMESATHPQTLIVYGKDGMMLPPPYGAPARLHSPVKLGYKNVKYLTRISFNAERNGGYWSDQGYEWYGGT